MQNYKKITIGILCIVLTVLAAYHGVPLLFGTPSETAITIRVMPGENLTDVAGRLKNKGVIRSRRAFLLWVKVCGDDTRIQAGEFVFHVDNGIIPVSRKLKNARPIEVAITVPEGLTIPQVADVFHEGCSMDTTAFIELCRDTALIGVLGIDAPSLEGYLFPDTYRFPEELTPEIAIRRMVKTFHKKFSTLTFDSTIHHRYSRHQIVIMASIVEKEAMVAGERRRIAGVFYNRLRRGIPLGADPTVRYLLKKYSGPLRVSELNNPSPYNTRIYRGLPPGPICSPGFGSLQAAASPLETRDLYFVAKWDGSGEHYFSKTQRQHNKKKRVARERAMQKRKAARSN
jgi:UPF0755 protein